MTFSLSFGSVGLPLLEETILAVVIAENLLGRVCDRYVVEEKSHKRGKHGEIALLLRDETSLSRCHSSLVSRPKLALPREPGTTKSLWLGLTA